jgi:hypothetical protein
MGVAGDRVEGFRGETRQVYTTIEEQVEMIINSYQFGSSHIVVQACTNTTTINCISYNCRHLAPAIP